MYVAAIGCVQLSLIFQMQQRLKAGSKRQTAQQQGSKDSREQTSGGLEFGQGLGRRPRLGAVGALDNRSAPREATQPEARTQG